MEGTRRRTTTTASPAGAQRAAAARSRTRKPPPPPSQPLPSGYFSLESFLVLACLTVSLLVLPLVLPPLPPPPILLLLVPIGILAVLLVLAFMPSDVRDLASTYL